VPNTIVHKKSSTPGATPSAGSLVAGELAVNTADGVVYLKRDDGAVVRSAAARDHAHGNINNDGTLTGAVVGGGGGSQASLLLHFDGTNGSTTFTDSGPNALAVTAYGNAAISTADSKFGGGSAYFDGDGDYLTVPASNGLEFGSGDFTIELWFIADEQQAQYAGLISKGQAGSVDPDAWSLEFNSPTELAFWLWVDSAGIGASGVTAGVWHHVALTRDGSTLRMFLDGVLTESRTTTSTIASNASGSLHIGSGWYAPASRSFTGYIDELRIVKGTAVYTANFTPPTAPFSSGGSLVHSPLVVTNSSGVIVPATQIPATAVSGLSGVAVSGSYNDLTDKPLPAEDNSLTNALIFG